MENKIFLVRDFIKSINKDFEVEIGDAFEVDINDETVFITFNSDDDLDNLYKNFLKEEFNVEIPIFVASILHEIGHIETFDDELYESRDVVYGLLKMQYDEGNADLAEYNNMYFRIPAEYDATYWGVQYYLKNKEKCDKLAKGVDLYD